MHQCDACLEDIVECPECGGHSCACGNGCTCKVESDDDDADNDEDDGVAPPEPPED